LLTVLLNIYLTNIFLYASLGFLRAVLLMIQAAANPDLEVRSN